MDLYGNDPQSLWTAFLLFHLILAGALWKMALRAKEETPWFAVVPILNLILMLKVARRPVWWVILFFVPLVNVVVAVIVTMALCVRFGVNKWAGLLALVSPLNLALFYYLAFGTKTIVETPEKPPSAEAAGGKPKIDAPPPSPPPAA